MLFGGLFVWTQGFFLVIWTHIIQSLVICTSILKLFLLVSHFTLCSCKTQLPSYYPICSFLISHPEEYSQPWPTCGWSCSDMTSYNRARDSLACHWVTLHMTERLQLPPGWLIHELLVLFTIRILSNFYEDHLDKVILIMFVQAIEVFEKWCVLLMEAKTT